MTGVGIEMREIRNLNPAPYIDQARKIIAVTREILGAGEPANGADLWRSAQRGMDIEESVHDKITTLGEQGGGSEAWLLILIPHIEWRIHLHSVLKACAMNASQQINFHAIEIRSCRHHLDEVITGLKTTRVHVLAISAVDRALARTIDLTAAESAMASYNAVTRRLQEEAERRVECMNFYCTPLDAKNRISPGPWAGQTREQEAVAYEFHTSSLSALQGRYPHTPSMWRSQPSSQRSWRTL